jgi:hypothetical protein
MLAKMLQEEEENNLKSLRVDDDEIVCEVCYVGLYDE